MVKSRKVSKKRIRRTPTKKVTRPTTKKETQPTPNPADNMSRLEYQQALMDPRFRAAMMGFNNPAGSNAMQMNSLLHERENKNNTLTKQLVAVNELANAKIRQEKLKNDLKQLKLDTNQQLTELKAKSDASLKQAEITRLKEKQEYDLRIQDLNATIASQKQANEEQQTRHKQEVDLLRQQHEKKMLDQETAFNEKIEPLREAIQQASDALEFNKQVFNQSMEMQNAQNEKVLAEIKLNHMETIQPIKEQTAVINDKLQWLQSVADTIKEWREAKWKLDDAERRAISEPIIMKLNTMVSELEHELAKNKQLYEEYDKQQKLLTQKVLLEQKVPSEVSDEYNEKIRQEKIRTHQMEITNAHAEKVEKAYQETEALISKIVTICAKHIPGFKLEYVGKEELNNQLQGRLLEIRTQQVELDKQLYESEALVKETKELAESKRKLAKVDAQIAAGTNEKQIERVNKLVTEKHLIDADIKNANEVSQLIGDEREQKKNAISKATYDMLQLYDKHPWAKEIAREVAREKYGNDESLYPVDFKEVLKRAEELRDKNAKLYSELPYDIQFDDQNANLRMAEFDKFLRDYGSDAQIARHNLHTQLEQKRAENALLYQQNDELQKRLKQSVALNKGLQSKYLTEDKEGYDNVLRSLGYNGYKQVIDLYKFSDQLSQLKAPAEDSTSTASEPFAKASDDPGSQPQSY